MKAFPQKYPIDPSRPWLAKENPVDTGMDLRDYFASKALQGLLCSIGQWSAGLPNHEFSESVAHDAYWIADAMMEARK